MKDFPWAILSPTVLVPELLLELDPKLRKPLLQGLEDQQKRVLAGELVSNYKKEFIIRAYIHLQCTPIEIKYIQMGDSFTLPGYTDNFNFSDLRFQGELVETFPRYLRNEGGVQTLAVSIAEKYFGVAAGNENELAITIQLFNKKLGPLTVETLLSSALIKTCRTLASSSLISQQGSSLPTTGSSVPPPMPHICNVPQSCWLNSMNLTASLEPVN